jgi:hypothetical protein
MKPQRKPNPIAIRVQALPGQKLPDDFMQETANHGGLYDRRDLSELWKNPKWSGKSGSENLVRDARLSTWKETLGEK